MTTYSPYSSTSHTTTSAPVTYSDDLPGTQHLFLLQPRIVFRARVNQASFTYPIAQVDFDTVGGGYTYLEPVAGQTIIFGSTLGASDLGIQRVRKAMTSTTLYFGRSSQGDHRGEVNLSDNCYIEIWDLFEVWSKIPAIDGGGVVYKDTDLAYTDQTIEPPPVANAGQWQAATIDATTGLITVAFDGTNSFATADSATITGYLWDVYDGTIVTGTTTDDAITATFPAGFRWVTLTVTDSNGKTHTARSAIYARDPADTSDTDAFQITSHKITPEGQQISIKVFKDIPETSYPDGTACMLWEGTSEPGTVSTAMVFAGYLHTEPTSIGAEKTGLIRETVLNCLDVGGKLATLPGFSQSVTRETSPTTWLQMANTNMDRYLHYLLHWHSTALEVTDWTWTGTGDDYPFVVLSSDGANLYDQVARRSKALVPDYLFTCDAYGRLANVVDPMVQRYANRTNIVSPTLTAADWSDLRYTHQRPPRYYWHRGNAIVADDTAIVAIFCVAPGVAPAQGELAQEQGEQLAINQSDLNDCEGHRYARVNAPDSHFTITLTASAASAPDARWVSLINAPALLRWIGLTITAATAAQRGLTLSAARGLVHEVNIRYDYQRTGMVKTVTIDWEKESIGTAAVTYTVSATGTPPPEFQL